MLFVRDTLFTPRTTSRFCFLLLKICHTCAMQQQNAYNNECENDNICQNGFVMLSHVSPHYYIMKVKLFRQTTEIGRKMRKLCNLYRGGWSIVTRDIKVISCYYKDQLCRSSITAVLSIDGASLLSPSVQINSTLRRNPRVLVNFQRLFSL